MNWAITEKDYSQRPALVRMAPKTDHHVTAKPDDAMLRRLREMANARRRFG